MRPIRLILLGLFCQLPFALSNGAEPEAASGPSKRSAGIAADTLDITVDFNRASGKIRRLNGTNLSAPINNADACRTLSRDLKELGIPMTRFHDAPLDDPGMRLVDVSRVFPLFHADPQDPENYFFAQTDDYIASCLATGSKVSYRLGESIEHSEKKYFVNPPKDYDKWADICINIIRHYNEGWAKGFHHNLDYWRIWTEPDDGEMGRKLWTGSWDDFIRLYVTASRKIKQRFPDLKVGGPAMMDAVGWRTGVSVARLDKFLVECQRQKAPLDFFSWNCYTDKPERVLKEPWVLRKALDAHGFKKTELHLSEWHYMPDSTWGERSGPPDANKRAVETMGGRDAAAFLCAVLSGWQDTPLDMAFYYTGTGLTWPGWGFYGAHGIQDKNKCYFGMKAFTLMAQCENRIGAQTSGNVNDVWVLAGFKESGEAAILVSCFKGAGRRIKVRLENRALRPGACRVSVLDAGHDLEALDAADVRFSDSEIAFDKADGSAVFLVELK